MFNFLSKNNLFNFILRSTGDEVLNPIYSGMTLLGPYVIGTVVVLCLFYGVFLGVKYAKAESPEDKLNMHKTIINFVIGAISVIVLISILYAIRKPLADLINGA